MKACRICGVEKPDEGFDKSKAHKGGRIHRCKECINKQRETLRGKHALVALDFSDSYLLTKHCRGCNIDKPREHFSRDPCFKDGRTSRCKECAKKALEAKLQNPEELKKFKERTYNAARKHKLKSYNLTLEQFDELVLNQGGMCAICDQDAHLHIDHDHSTGKVRALLCSNCNRAIGLLKESAEVITKAAEYVKKYSEP